MTTTNTTENDALKASVFQRLHPRVYLERFLAENYRPDGRVPDAWRDVNLNVGVCVRGDLQPTEERMDVLCRLHNNCGWLCTCSSGQHDSRLRCEG